MGLAQTDRVILSRHFSTILVTEAGYSYREGVSLPVAYGCRQESVSRLKSKSGDFFRLGRSSRFLSNRGIKL